MRAYGMGWIAVVLCLAALPGAQAETRQIALVQSVTGPAAFIGVGARDGMLLGLEQANTSAALPGLTLMPVVADDASDRGQSLSLLTRFAQDPSVLMMLGPSTGAIAGASGQAANQNKLPMYTVTNLVAALDAGPWTFIQTQPGSVAIPNAADFAVGKLHVKSCAAAELLDNESYVQQRKLFEELVRARGVKTGAVAAVKLTDTDFSAVAVKIVDQQPDCVFVALPAVAAANFITQLRQAGLDPAAKIIGMTTLASNELISIGGPAVEGVYALSDWVPGGVDANGQAFAAAYKARFGREPDIWAAEGYSMVAVLVSALKAAGPNPSREALRDAMARTKDVKVVVGTGTYSFDANRIPSYGNDVLVVSKGRFVQVPR